MPDVGQGQSKYSDPNEYDSVHRSSTHPPVAQGVVGGGGP